MTWWSDSKGGSRKTPPYRNGTIARPLPKTNAPAVAKKMNSVTNVPRSTVESCATRDTNGTPTKLAALDLNQRTLGGDLTNQTTIPAARNSNICSDSVRIVQVTITP